jgi:hypothetical protein
MNGISLLLLWASLGVVYSWRTGVDGQQEYVLQIEPEILQSLAAGEEIYSDVPADAGSVQRLSIIVLPKGGTPAARTQLAEDRFRQLALTAGRYASNDPALVSDSQPTILWPSRANPEQTYGVSVGWQPDVKGSLQYFVQIDATLLRTLAVGDELYVPVDPSAGRPARFIVKSGKEQLPRISAAQSQLAQGGGLVSPLVGGRGRAPAATAPGVSYPPTSPWSSAQSPSAGSQATDYSRTNRTNLANSNPADTRGNSLGNAGGNTYAPQNGTALNPPNSYSDYGRGQNPPPPYSAAATQYDQASSTRPGPLAASSNFDRYQNPNAGAYDQANYPPPGTGPQSAGPQIARNNTQQPVDTRLAGLPAAPANAGGQPALWSTGGTPPGPEKPWGPLLFVSFALFFSIGGNLYLAYTALEFHSRYRNAIERLRSAARSA